MKISNFNQPARSHLNVLPPDVLTPTKTTKTAVYAAVAASTSSGFMADFHAAPSAKANTKAAGHDEGSFAGTNG
jgi:hypothetical protein